MVELGIVESTLFVPMLGRIYSSEHFPQILYDATALSLKSKLPADFTEHGRQTEYTYMASAVRSVNMDRYISLFLHRTHDGVVVQLGCGLETAFNRNDNGRTRWYAVDLPQVIDYRRTVLPESERERYIGADAFTDTWIRRIRNDVGNVPMLVTAGGLFYYFDEHTVIGLLNRLSRWGQVEIVFDAVSRFGLYMMRRRWMKRVGHEEARMSYYVNSAEELALKIGGEASVLADESYYRHIDKRGLSRATRINMGLSDLLGMVRMIHLKL